MKKLVSLLMVLLPGASLAGADCRVVEYPDHYEAVCVEAAAKTAAAPQRAKKEETLAGTGASEQEPQEEPQEEVRLNGLTRTFGAVWLKEHRAK
jgi:hypothetical protein